MTSTNLKQEMMRHVGGASFISATELAIFLNYSPASYKAVRSKYLRGLEKVGNSYFIPDVVSRVMSERK